MSYVYVRNFFFNFNKRIRIIVLCTAIARRHSYCFFFFFTTRGHGPSGHVTCHWPWTLPLNNNMFLRHTTCTIHVGKSTCSIAQRHVIRAKDGKAGMKTVIGHAPQGATGRKFGSKRDTRGRNIRENY